MGNIWDKWDAELAWGIVGIVGVIVAAIAFGVGWFLINRRRARLRELAAHARDWKDKASPQDAFRYGMGMARRKSVRLSGNQIPVRVCPDGIVESPLEGWVVDRSQGGLRLRVPEPIPVGVVLRVRCLNAPESLPWAELQVKNARDKQTYWEVGCQFLNNPGEEVLRSFGSM